MFYLSGTLLGWSTLQTVLSLGLVVILVAYYIYRRRLV